ncbi:DUF429 domain-containing protein [Streptomyces phyllanthi]|uniref:DUF429 domain-containing protein n=1 Tax=Streptomyces phyllanthi TaxID=1803180 RepID=A0A5N8VYG7_9ACTN|nr:DUF429 domain-containing protein [Streptomyces phyllanthi]MPY39144.1 DUF429 domain-containing protein [Streptomyces phyllanthi]
MRTLGVDLSASPPRTAAAVIEWSAGGAVARAPLLGCTDEQLLKLLSSLREEDQAGVDCPFGWPAAFAAAMSAHAAPQPTWPGRDAQGADDLRALRYRHTDLIVTAHAPRPPLSVSFDKLGAVAARWARLQALLGGLGHSVDRTGAGQVAEVYPAAARHQWGLTLGTVDELQAAAPWLRIAEEARRPYAASRDAYDALIAALVARAIRCRLTAWPATEDIDLARTEGWIHFPGPGTLGRLLDAH